ncbi:MAG TPA: ankyrin repeat domain-containing protein [Gammaproteobacteria bacterium]|nr:ankyrin repeat domain-containing protein [Gammaproteobacteria bacterium]
MGRIACAAAFGIAISALTATAAEPTLLEAAEAGSSADVLTRLADGADPNVEDASGTTPIMYAAHYGDFLLVDALIEAGADVTAQNALGTSAITEAAIIGHAQILSALVAAGADPNFENPEGETPIMAVARTGNVDAAKVLVEAGADINAREDWGGQSAIMWAAARGNHEMVRFLAANGAELDTRGVVRQWPRKVITEPRPKDMNKGGFTALLYAAREGCIECARALIEAGADPDVHDPERVTPLSMALLNLHYDFAAYMIEAGADVDKWDLFGRTPLYMAADTHTLPVMGNGAMVVIPSMDELTALDVARHLLEAGADPNIRLKRRPPYRNVPQDRGGDSILAQGATPLLRAARAGDTAFVNLLLEHGALVDLPSKEGVTPLMAAAGVEFGQRVTRGRNRTEEDVYATIEVLLAAGADVNAQMVREPDRRFFQNGSALAQGTSYSIRGRQVPSPHAVPHHTALHGAAMKGYNSVVELLIEHGADLTVRDATGALPFDVAMGEYEEDFVSTEAAPLLDTASLIAKLMIERGLEVPARLNDAR